MKKYIIYIAIIAIAGFGFYKKIYIPKHTYETTNAIQADMDVRVNGVGNVETKNTYKIGSIYSGKVSNLTINEGEFIKKGTTIAIVDSVDLKDKIDEQIALLSKLNADIKSLYIDKKSANVSYKYQNEIFLKNEKLYKKHAISQLDFIKYKTNKDITSYQVENLNAKIISFKSQATQIKSNINGLKEKLSRYTIVSPVSGYVVKKSISNFQIISPNQTIIEIVNPKDVWVATYVDTRISGDIKLGDMAKIKLRSSTKELSGKVVNIKPINNSVTNEREVDVAFIKLPIPFYIQEQANVSISTNKLKNIIKIPIKTITIYKEQTGVWVVDDTNIVSFVPLKILAYEKKYAAVKGFDLTQNIVIPNPKKKTLNNGMKIIND